MRKIFPAFQITGVKYSSNTKGKMTMIEEILEYNRKFVEEKA